MPQLKLSVCIEMLFNNLDLLDRPAAVAEVGLPGLEFWGWKGKDLDGLKAAADTAGVAIAGFATVADAPMVDPEKNAIWLEGAKESILEAKRLGVKTLIATTGQEMEICRKAQHDSVVACLKAVAPFAEEQGVTMVLEPLNVLTDHKGYFLVTSDEGFEIVDEVASPNVKLLFDIYHQQISEGNLIVRITENIAKIGHFHVADVPGRFEPGTGEINYKNVFARMAELDYDGFVGLEFRPSTDAATALKQVKCIAGL